MTYEHENAFTRVEGHSQSLSGELPHPSPDVHAALTPEKALRRCHLIACQAIGRLIAVGGDEKDLLMWQQVRNLCEDAGA